MPGEATITRVYDAPRETMWRYFSEPEFWAEWFGTPPYRSRPDTISLDLRPGGRWSARMVHESDGSELPFLGEIREVTPPERLVLSFEDPDDPSNPNQDVLTLSLRDVGDGRTEVTYHQAGNMPEEQYRLVEQGVGGFFEQLAGHVSSA